MVGAPVPDRDGTHASGGARACRAPPGRWRRPGQAIGGELPGRSVLSCRGAGDPDGQGPDRQQDARGREHRRELGVGPQHRERHRGGVRQARGHADEGDGPAHPALCPRQRDGEVDDGQAADRVQHGRESDVGEGDRGGVARGAARGSRRPRRGGRRSRRRTGRGRRWRPSGRGRRTAARPAAGAPSTARRPAARCRPRAACGRAPSGCPRSSRRVPRAASPGRRRRGAARRRRAW